MRRGDRRDIKLTLRETITETDTRPAEPGEFLTIPGAEYLGAGHWCRAWRVPADFEPGQKNADYPKADWAGRVLLITKENDYSKEILSRGGINPQLDGLPHIPVVDTVTEDHRGRAGEYHRVYLMDYYPTLTADNREAWRQFRALDKAHDTAHREKCFATVGKEPIYTFAHQISNETLDLARPDIPESLAEALQALIDAAASYGSSWGVEFRKANLGMDTEGRLILRDCLFDAELLWKEREQQRRKRERLPIGA